MLRACDSLDFNDPAEAFAYLALHLPDRYCRTFQVLEHLLVQGMLPLGKTDRFAAVDIGAGPGPSIFAVRAFYAALSLFAAQHTSATPVSVLGHAAVIERSQGMSRAMHYFAEQLIMIERGQDPHRPAAAPINSPNPYAAQLASSATPFGAGYDEFEMLDLRGQHVWEREQVARQIDDELSIGRATARRLAHEEPVGVPSAYALALMSNFLTTQDVSRFEAAIRRLMGEALVPGGIVVVLGATHPSYGTTYLELDRIARNAGLRAAGFDTPFQAGSRPEEHERLQILTRRIWRQLKTAAQSTAEVERELRRLRSADISTAP